MKNCGNNVPGVVIIDFGEVISEFSPPYAPPVISNTPIFNKLNPYAYIYAGNTRPLILVALRLGVPKIIEALYVVPTDEQETLVWQLTEETCSDISDFWENVEAIESFNILVDTINEACFKKLRYALSPYGLESQASNYLFHHWVSNTAAAFMHWEYEILLS